MLLVTLLTAFIILYLFFRHGGLPATSRIFELTLLKSVTGCLAILIASVGAVCLFGPHQEKTSFRIPADSLSTIEADMSTAHLLSETPEYHYELIQKVSTFSKYASCRNALLVQYGHIATMKDPSSRDIGNFGLGVMAAIDNDYEEALERLGSIGSKEFGYRHFCQGDVYLEKGDPENAAQHFREELTIAGGNFRAAYRELLSLYKNAGDYSALRDLLDMETAGAKFPHELARRTYLYNGEIFHYVLRVAMTITQPVKTIGFAAALIVSLIWFMFLIRLDLFRRTRRIMLLAMFGCGCLLVPAVIAFNDLFDLYSGWSRSGAIANDLLYCVLMIGAPEEFAKILPVIVLLLFLKKFREPLDYILFASASALGFAFVENLLYFKDISDGIIHGRAFLAVVGHMIDSSFLAYGLVIGAFRSRDRKQVWIAALSAFGIASISHGIYDFLLYHGHRAAFVVFFIVVVRIWVVMINNCLNNSPVFSYAAAQLTRRVDGFIAITLTSIFAFEYLITGFVSTREDANAYMITNASGAILMIVLFSTTLFDLDLVKGYWRNVTFAGGSVMTRFRAFVYSCRLNSWFRSHNYVGLPVTFEEALSEPIGGIVVERVILYHMHSADPDWFVLRLGGADPAAGETPVHILVKLRSRRDALQKGSAVPVFFKAVPNPEIFKEPQLRHDSFPFLGWGYLQVAPVR